MCQSSCDEGNVSKKDIFAENGKSVEMISCKKFVGIISVNFNVNEI